MTCGIFTSIVSEHIVNINKNTIFGYYGIWALQKLQIGLYLNK